MAALNQNVTGKYSQGLGRCKSHTAGGCKPKPEKKLAASPRPCRCPTHHERPLRQDGFNWPGGAAVAIWCGVAGGAPDQIVAPMGGVTGDSCLGSNANDLPKP
jgi:hypothetical protein